MKLLRSFFILSYGLFTIAAQTILFREFITTFEGNDIAVGVFFGSWFLWVGLGAFAVYKSRALAEKLQPHTEFLLLAYIPAFILQWLLILFGRRLAGIESYELFPTALMVAMSIIVNGPVSCITGMLFPIISKWFQRDQALVVSKVYVLEAAGSFCGGLGVTLLLAAGIGSAKIFFIISLIVSLAVFCARLTRPHKLRATPVAVIFLGFLYCLTTGLDINLTHRIQTIKWAVLLPADTFAGSFQTAQAQYLYGNYQGQWVIMRQGSVIEAMPDAESSARVTAICLSQNPQTKKVLVIGSGLELSRQFLQLEQIEDVTWVYCDTEYPAQLEKYAPEEFRITDKRLHRLNQDVRDLSSEKQRYYNIVIINLPDATSSVMNRYYTYQFYQQVAESLTPDGVLAVRISGGENIMGSEITSLGASIKLTLRKVFSQLVITPGEETWLLASNSESLTGDPGTLMDRFDAIKGSADIFPPQGLLSIYLPDRAAKALKAYDSCNLPDSLLINRDDRPLTSLYSLLLSAKQSGAPATKLIKYLAVAGIWPFVLTLVVFAVLRIVYVSRNRCQGPPSAFNSTFLVFSAGCIGIAVIIVLMYLYQTRFGSLYLHVGIISSIFMMGLTLGGALTRYLLVKRKVPMSVLLSTMLIIHIAILAAAAYWPVPEWTRVIFGVIFALAGFCTGSYFPLAAAHLADCGIETSSTASRLEMADHIGAAAGAFLTGLVIVPVVGVKVTLLIFILLILVNILFAALAQHGAKSTELARRHGLVTRKPGYILFGTGVCIILWSNLLAHSAQLLAPILP
ncbi:MAG: spermine/spermidine synthase domain-containing protein, partial [Planctomycetota bacterium]